MWTFHFRPRTTMTPWSPRDTFRVWVGGGSEQLIILRQAEFFISVWRGFFRILGADSLWSIEGTCTESIDLVNSLKLTERAIRDDYKKMKGDRIMLQTSKPMSETYGRTLANRFSERNCVIIEMEKILVKGWRFNNKEVFPWSLYRKSKLQNSTDEEWRFGFPGLWGIDGKKRKREELDNQEQGIRPLPVMKKWKRLKTVSCVWCDFHDY